MDGRTEPLEWVFCKIDLTPTMHDLQNEITRLLIDLGSGNRAAHTLNATALVHEAYLKLIDQNRVNWQNRAHFFAIAAQSMRRILITYAQSRLAEKRGGGQPLVTFDEQAVLREVRAEELVALDDALSELAMFNERQSKVVEYQFYGGLTHEEIAEVLGVSVPTVRRDWRLARAWLSSQIKSLN